ncbi:acyltransferase [Azotobacter beijerinckii]|uniref:acyltransferase n=1 Tax=Azotobacter beijerinckii TaxID=170623 RepID=UPI002952D0D6|nr:acyltransferase [Azotobacter beijerinckii]MDV7212374.1 acyltransferase [Azotobacter beijerinckii]
MSQTVVGSRLTWIDANRFYAACGVVMIHCATDAAGGPFSEYEMADRVAPAILRALATISSSELFLLLSLFLIALKIDRRPLSYTSVILFQIERLTVPLIVWSIFYAFFKLIKARDFGYEQPLINQLHEWNSWVDYLLLGNAQYHLHFLPTMFFLVLFYPAMRAAIRWPALILVVLPMLYTMNWIQVWLWERIDDPYTREYLVFMVKILGYTSYGIAAFALYGIWKRSLGSEDCRHLFRFLLILALVAFLAKLTYIANSVLAGQWINNQGASRFADLLLPIIVFSMFLMGQHREWSSLYSRFAKLTYGVYLIHPAWIDAFDTVLKRSVSIQIQHPIWIVLAKYMLVLPLSFATVYLISKSRLTAWIVGVGPVPFLSKFISGRHLTHEKDIESR